MCRGWVAVSGVPVLFPTFCRRGVGGRNHLTRDIIVSRIVRGVCAALSSVDARHTAVLCASSAAALLYQLNTSRTARRYLLLTAKKTSTALLTATTASLLAMTLAQIVARKISDANSRAEVSGCWSLGTVVGV